ncbi:hypothetical protein PAHAL_4G179400 [Panicum hallii]|uniref:Uncharacterized protein n=1 Tax=Panicum hallii TaxID=206008 RepID=A0A2S3HJG0_9POAL|nr:classical arabinogalactan protein 6-like [Panicum hallii]PAN24354.1 hypothetical protein PAHAL_4G179400 [Panicum hallii]
MSRITVAILFYILAVAALSAAKAPAESPKASKAPTPAKTPEAAKKAALAKAPEAAPTPSSSRKSGPAAATPTTTSSSPSSTDGDASSPPPPSTPAASSAAKGPAEGPVDASQSSVATLRSGASIVGAVGVVATMIFY